MGYTMRDYSVISRQFWISDLGLKLRGDHETQAVCLYLLCNSHSNSIGLYYCPMQFVAHELGCLIKGASKALQRLIEWGFCEYDFEREYVWVVAMAQYQIAEGLKPGDKRIIFIQRIFDAVPQIQLKQRFYARYGIAFALQHEAPSKPLRSPLASPFEAPSKPMSMSISMSITEEKTLSPVSPPVSPKLDPELNTEFNTWYKKYPRRVERKSAATAWKNLARAEQLECLDQTPRWIRYHEQQQTSTEFIPHPTTYLHGKRWRDELTVTNGLAGRPPDEIGPVMQQYLAVLKREET